MDWSRYPPDGEQAERLVFLTESATNQQATLSGTILMLVQLVVSVIFLDVFKVVCTLRRQSHQGVAKQAVNEQKLHGGYRTAPGMFICCISGSFRALDQST